MAIQPLRTPTREVREPTLYELDPLRFDGRSVTLALSVRVTDDGAWRGRLEFEDGEQRRATAEIFCGRSEDELWHSVRALGEHHLRDLYRSLA